MNSRNYPMFFLSVLFMFLFFSSAPHLTSAADTISIGESIAGNQTIISKEGNFELGFFAPGKSPNYYIAIWYKKVSVKDKTAVWVANRDKPILDPNSAELRLLGNGNLALFNQSKNPIWSTNLSSSTMNSTEAFLGDDGNLVLRDGSDPSVVIWQSFDYPSNTWLPGGKIAYNKLTNKSQLLTSWKNQEDPAPGIFSLELEPTQSQYLIRWNGTEQVWTSGPWNEQTKIFDLVPEMRLNYLYNFSYVRDENESYFTYTVYNKSLVSRFVMDYTGQIKQYTWSAFTQQWNLFWSQPKQQCDVYGVCGPFGVCNQDTLKCDCLQGFDKRFPKDWDLSDTTGGCVRRTRLQCGVNDVFSRMPNMKLPENPPTSGVGSAEECKAACSNDCSCTAYVFGSSGCSLWGGQDGNLLNAQQQSNGGQELYLRLARSDIRVPEGKPKKKKSITGAVVGAIVGIVIFLALVLVLFWRWRVRRSGGTSKTVEGTLVAFTYRDLQSATKNFSQKLGGGGFGSVFKGVLPDSTVIAVKKLEGLSQGEKQFRSEVSTIGTIQHVNLVRLRGFCSEGTKRCLVYDFMPKGSLDSHLFHQKDNEIFDWKTRYQIALGTARGLAYLHEKCRDCIIHCDIKPENILLDAEFCPKVADFGLAKLVGREFSRVLTTMRGTRGYLAPEWISGVAITAKADVYSYGMMLFEVISGRRNAEHYSNDEKIRFFPTWAATKMNEGDEIISLVDSRLEGNADVEELTRACRVACWCIQDDEANRPTMGQVVQILEGVLEVNPPPIPRSLHVLVENQDNVFFFSESSNQTSQARSNTTSSTSSQAKSSTSSMSSNSGSKIIREGGSTF